MSDEKKEKERELSAKYVMRLYREESMISGFLHVRIKRIRNLMRAWKAENEKKDNEVSEKQDLKC
jgi:hypothetical protein